MSDLIVISADGVNRGLLIEALGVWGWAATAVPPGLVQNAMPAPDQSEAPLVLLDARRNAESVFQAAAIIRHRFGASTRMVMICFQVNKSSAQSLERFGITAIVETDTCDASVLREILHKTYHGHAHSESDAEESEAEETDTEPSRLDEESERQSANVRWGGLYDDRGLLESETAPSGSIKGQAKRFADEHRDPLQREIPRSEMESLLSEYVDAKPLKENVQLALSRVRNSQVSVDDLAEVIRRDQGLSAKVLQLANSSAYRRGRPVKTVEQASVRIGLEGMRQAITVASVAEQMGIEENDLVSPVLLWEHSFATATIAFEIARATRLCQPEDAFMSGLLHDLGRVVMFDVLGSRYPKAMRMARENSIPPHQAEKTMFEMNHADAADVLFKSWNFDPGIVRPISNHHLSEKNTKHLDPEYEAQTHVLRFANRLAHALLFGDSGDDWIEDVPLQLGGGTIADQAVLNCIQRTERAASEMRTALTMVSSNASTPAAYSDLLRDRLLRRVRLPFIGEAGRFDAMKHLTGRLSAAGADDCTVLVARAGGGSDAEKLRAQAKELDSDMDAGEPLPAIALTESDAVDPTVLLNDRRVLPITMPFRIVSLIQAINELIAA